MDLNLSQYRYRYHILSECGPRWKNEDTIRVVEMPVSFATAWEDTAAAM